MSPCEVDDFGYRVEMNGEYDRSNPLWVNGIDSVVAFWEMGVPSFYVLS